MQSKEKVRRSIRRLSCRFDGMVKCEVLADVVMRGYFVYLKFCFTFSVVWATGDGGQRDDLLKTRLQIVTILRRQSIGRLIETHSFNNNLLTSQAVPNNIF